MNLSIILRQAITYTKEGIFSSQKNIVYDVISQTHNYKKFIPWCMESSIIQQISSTQNQTELKISFSKFKGLSYISHVFLKPSSKTDKRCSVISICKDPPLRHLKSVWELEQIAQTRTKVNYQLQFEFISPIYQLASSIFVNHLGVEMWSIFENQSSKRQSQNQEMSLTLAKRQENSLEEFLGKNILISQKFHTNKQFEKKVISLHQRLKTTDQYERKMLFEISNLLVYH